MTNQLELWHLITGASRGIGYETALQLCRVPNVRVIALARDRQRLDELVAASDSKVIGIQHDLQHDAPQKLVSALEKNGISALQGIIHNAGLLINKPFGEVTLADLQASYQVNVFAPYLLTQALMPFLRKASKAHIVNISSMGGVQGSTKFAGLSTYSTAKGAVCTLTECLAQELATDNISVNCLALGSVQTEMLSAAFPGFKAPLNAHEMAEFVSWFLLNGRKFFNGKILPVASTTP
jgi:NAD(P)-dependent dehydrogenase (short-subunit alcohol dehydrogenase family)